MLTIEIKIGKDIRKPKGKVRKINSQKEPQPNEEF